jgi:hypothetical protein
MGPLYAKGVWGSIVATIRQSAWDPLGPGEARHKPWRTTCGCSTPPLGGDPFWTHRCLTPMGKYASPIAYNIRQ